MKAILINGSPRKEGNTAIALRAVRKGLEAKFEVECINAAELKLLGCINCDCCKKNGGNCVLPDGGKEFMDKVAAADLIIFGTPVYWWGVTSQLKSALDKFYSKDAEFHNAAKKLGIIAVGAADLDDPQYKLISGQFKCIADFLGWEIVLDKSFSASGAGELATDRNALAELTSAAAVLA